MRASACVFQSACVTFTLPRLLPALPYARHPALHHPGAGIAALLKDVYGRPILPVGQLSKPKTSPAQVGGRRGGGGLWLGVLRHMMGVACKHTYLWLAVLAS